jgi:hypothetical protein
VKSSGFSVSFDLLDMEQVNAYLNTTDKNTTDPFYWAAFTIIGNGAPLKTTTKSYWEYALILSGLLVIVGGIYYKTKKNTAFFTVIRQIPL